MKFKLHKSKKSSQTTWWHTGNTRSDTLAACTDTGYHSKVERIRPTPCVHMRTGIIALHANNHLFVQAWGWLHLVWHAWERTRQVYIHAWQWSRLHEHIQGCMIVPMRAYFHMVRRGLTFEQMTVTIGLIYARTFAHKYIASHTELHTCIANIKSHW
jgi:hypothetical protein